MKLKQSRALISKPLKELKKEELGQEMLKMLRNELDTKRVTIWEEFCSIICCERSRTYLDFILENFSKREEAERERREIEKALQEELMKE